MYHTESVTDQQMYKWKNYITGFPAVQEKTVKAYTPANTASILAKGTTPALSKQTLPS
jgi:hypothetical protein